MSRRAAGNKGFVIAEIPCFADTFVQGGSSVLRMNVSVKTQRHRPPETSGCEKSFLLNHLAHPPTISFEAV